VVVKVQKNILVEKKLLCRYHHDLGEIFGTGG